MSQNSTNVFNEGLNYDLNPTTTPNNVLTDCVNGTFLTFNGDELALQNDAGNTKIAVPGTNPTEYVELSPGFYPLGIKEYGGVLYIVSANKPDDSIWQPWSNTAWAKGAIVYQTVLDEIVYYKSLVANNTNGLPTYSTSNWEVLGSKTDAINKLSLVEFGSYPSPEGASVRTFPGIARTYNNTTVALDNLYKKLVINNAIFKSSRYIIFDGAFSNDIDITRVSGHLVSNTQITDTKLFWRMRLFHYLSNGYFDLTTDIEEKYKAHLGANYTDYTDGLHQWFTDDQFRYYCPTQFKGQLAISLEIEPLTLFALHGYPGFSYDGTVYTFELNVDAIGIGLIDVPQARVEIWLGGIPYDFGSGVYYEDITITDTVGTFTLTNIAEENIDSEIRYRITPIIEVEGDKYDEGKYPDAYDDLPQEYIDQFVITGSRLVDTLYDNIVFEVDSGTTECIEDIPYELYQMFTLKSVSGDLLDLDLAPTATPHVFVKQEIWDADPNYDSNNGVITIATYNTVMPDTYDFYPNSVVVQQPTVFEVIMTMFKKVVVVAYSEDCDTSLTFDPDFVGITSTAGIHLLKETGEYKFINIPGITRSSDGVDAGSTGDRWYVDGVRNCVAYDKDDKLVFVGGKYGNLMIVDISNPLSPQYKEINIASDSTDLTTVKLIAINNPTTSTTAKTIYIGTANGKVLKQQYYSLYTDYISGYAIPMAIPGATYIRDFHHYSGFIYAVGKEFQGYRVSTADLQADPQTSWVKFFDIQDFGYKLFQGQQYLWWLGYDVGQSQSERIMAFDRSNPISGGLEAFNLPHPSTGNQSPTDGLVLLQDDLLIFDIRGGQGVWRTHGFGVDPTYIGRDLWNNYNVRDDNLYVGGGVFDGSEFAYISTKRYSSYKLKKYRAYGTGTTWTDLSVPGFYQKLFLY